MRQTCNLGSIRGKVDSFWKIMSQIEAAYIWVVEAAQGAGFQTQQGIFSLKNLCPWNLRH